MTTETAHMKESVDMELRFNVGKYGETMLYVILIAQTLLAVLFGLGLFAMLYLTAGNLASPYSRNLAHFDMLPGTLVALAICYLLGHLYE